jgi:hypothetical protein
MGSNLHQLIDTLLNDFHTGMKHFLKPQNPDYSLTAPLHTVHEKLKKILTFLVLIMDTAKEKSQVVII